jgi:2-iminobutanoate/2-iminopropanoate deaminase
MKNRKVIMSPSAPTPIGPYSQAIEANGFIFCSGQIPLDPVTGQLIQGDIATQARQILANFEAVLQAAGSNLDLTVKLTVYLTQMGDFAALNEVLSQRFPYAPPARAVVEVKGLPKGAAVEMDLIALKRS